MQKTIIYMLLIYAAVASTQPAISVLQHNSNSTMLEFELPEYVIETVTIDGQNCARIVIPGQVTFLTKGMPELPTVPKNMIIPDDGQMAYRIVKIEYQTISVNTLAPSKGNIFRDVDPSTVPYTFDRFYDTDAWWPANNIEIYEPFIMRDYRGMTVRFNPFQYNPARGELKIVQRAVVEIFKTASGGANVLHQNNRSVTREFASIYDNLFVNFGTARYDSISERAGRMVIITADAYVSNLAPFVEWKRRKGIETKVVTVSSIGNNQNSIKAYIQNEYDAGDLVWVLFVGDGNEVVPAIGTVGSATGDDADPVYAYTAGSDYYPDLFVSRFSSRGGNAVNIDKQVSRSVGYERDPMLGADWYHVGLGVASAQGSPADSTRANWLRDSLLDYTYTTVNKSYDYWGTSTMIKGFIEDGASIINYIGHGSTTAWSNGGGFSITNINQLNNPWMLPFVISVACFVGDFNGADCYCEASVTAGEVNQPDGFVVHWGSVISQAWVPPCYGQEGAVNLLTHDKKNTAGGYFFNGACYMIEQYSGGNEGVQEAQAWTIFGDASLQLRSDTPDAMTVNHAAIINLGQATFAVSAPGVPNALVGLYIDTLLVGHGYTDGSGNVTVDLDPAPAVPGYMHVTVTAYNKVPYLDSVPITAPTGAYIVMASTILSAGTNGQANPGETVQLGVWAENVGVTTANGVYGLLSSSDPHVSLVVDSSWYGNILANDSSLSSPHYQFSIGNDCPNNHTISFDLEFHDNLDSIWTANPAVTVYAPVLTYQNVTVMDGGNGVVDPGETVDIVVTIENEGGATAESTTSSLQTSCTFVTIDDNSGAFGNIAPGDTSNNSADPYTITADSLTPTGTAADFQIVITSGVYVDTLEFSLVIGKKHYYIWNPDPTPTPGQNMHSVLGGLGYSGDIGASLASDLTLYQSVFVCVGIYASNFVINSGSAEATALVNYLQNQDGRVYLEGGDVWYYDPLGGGYNFCPLFGISAVSDGSDDMGPVLGETGTFTAGMNFNYAGENNWMDHINATGSGFVVFRDGNNNYNCGVANDAGTYRTVGTSFELGMLVDGAVPSTRAVLLDSVMHFFGITVMPGVEEGMGLTGLPLRTQLAAVYPNPVLRVMSIRYQLAREAVVELAMYDAAGRLVRTFADGVQSAGYYTVQWDGRDDLNRKVPAGVYFVRLNTDDYQDVQKTVLLK
ncbi:MAG: T9SS type A sorting domain-containing protein [candidate division WOR-3 bacterium]|nr:MAG: T9SS type A sorting domain-containing protein [candidate division WOR-3 bacterium]